MEIQSNLPAILEQLRLLEKSEDRVQVGFTASNGKSDRPVTVWSASEAADYCRSMSETAEGLGITVRFTIYRIEN